MVATKPMSKTKALAMRRKPAAVKAHLASAASACSKSKGSSKPDEMLMAKLMEQYILYRETENDEDDFEQEEQGDNTSLPGLSFCDILKSMGMNDRNTGWRNAWKALIQENMIEPAAGTESGGGTFTSPFRLTSKGVDESSTPELKAALEQAKQQRPKTNAEHHERIKSKLMNNRGVQIFDLLLNEGPLSRLELAAKLGINHTGAYFSYALQQLRELGYAENVKVNGTKMKIQLTNKAFIAPRDVKEDPKTDDDQRADATTRNAKEECKEDADQVTKEAVIKVEEESKLETECNMNADKLTEEEIVVDPLNMKAEPCKEEA